MAHTRKYAGAGQAVIHCAVLAVWCIVGCSRPDAYTQPQSNIDRQDNERSSITVAVAEGVAGFATSESCRECHREQYKSWHRSYHRTMTATAEPDHVKGRFDGRTIRVDGYDCIPSREDNRFLMTLVNPAWEAQLQQQGGDPRSVPDPPQQVYQIGRVIGSHHQQVYLSQAPDGAWHTLPLVWDIVRERWITRKSSFLAPRGESLYHNTKLWNNGCIFCHNTGPRPGLQVQASLTGTSYSWDSRVAELGIACEACHGAAADHVEYQLAQREHAASSPASPSPQDVNGAAAAEPSAHARAVVQPATLSQEQAVLVCARCHGKMVATAEFDRACLVDGDFFEPGNPDYSQRYDHPQLTADEPFDERRQGQYFWSDGTPRTTALEYQGMTASSCYLNGQMNCFSCHSMHSPHAGDPDDQLRFSDDPATGAEMMDRACTQCHSTLTDSEALAAHTHHATDSSGSRCYNCHMPYQAYALHKRVRSHRITVPTATVTQKHGVPNACNQCHVDRSVAWTTRQLSGWKGAVVDASPDEHKIPMVIEHALTGHALQRALAVAQLGDADNFSLAGQNWRSRILLEGLSDPYESVRLLAGQALQQQPGFEDCKFDFIADPLVRQEQMRVIRNRLDRQETSQARAQLAALLGVEADQIATTIKRLRQRQNAARISINE